MREEKKSTQVFGAEIGIKNLKSSENSAIINIESERSNPLKKKLKNVTGSRPTRERENAMTNREFYEAVVNANVNDELTEKAQEFITKMDAQNAARREKTSKKALENAPLVDQVVGMLGEEPITATDIAAALEVSAQKASSLARTAVKEGRAVSQDVKGPKGKCKGYTLA